MGYKVNGVDTGGLPLHLVIPLIEKYGVPYFVETGTANGDSVRWAAWHFLHCWTIELVDGRANVGGIENITFMNGDSSVLLPKVITDLKELRGDAKRQWVLFYLDAHYSGDTPNESDYPECPLLEEIKCVAGYGEDAIIIIDDARLFLGSPPHPHDPTEWPGICEIFHLLKEKFPYHHITITDDYVLAIPVHLRQAIDDEWRSRFYIRYPSESDKLKQQVKDVHAALLNYINT